jgi:hypothetical protein
METTKVEPEKKEVKHTTQEFADAYQKLCDEYGFRIVVSPSYISRDDGTFSTILQYTVGELPKR